MNTHFQYQKKLIKKNMKNMDIGVKRVRKQEGPILYMGDSEIIWKYWHKWHYTQSILQLNLQQSPLGNGIVTT